MLKHTQMGVPNLLGALAEKNPKGGGASGKEPERGG